MGCCLTTAATKQDTKILPKPRDTSPPEPGEESVKVKVKVKEVLSENPKKPPPPNSKPTGEELRSKNDVVPMKNYPVAETASEVLSELYTYSYTPSLSAATTTTIGTGIEAEDDTEVTQKVNKPPVKPVSERQPRKERNVRVTSGTVTTGYRNRNVVGREATVRRRREVGQVRKVQERSTVKLKRSNDVGVMPVSVTVPETEMATGESLDNPLVSLECFIFL